MNLNDRLIDENCLNQMYNIIVQCCFKLNNLKKLLMMKHVELFILMMSSFAKYCFIVFEINSHLNDIIISRWRHVFYIVIYVVSCMMLIVFYFLIFEMLRQIEKIEISQCWWTTTSKKISFVKFFKIFWMKMKN